METVLWLTSPIAGAAQAKLPSNINSPLFFFSLAKVCAMDAAISWANLAWHFWKVKDAVVMQFELMVGYAEGID